MFIGRNLSIFIAIFFAMLLCAEPQIKHCARAAKRYKQSGPKFFSYFRLTKTSMKTAIIKKYTLLPICILFYWQSLAQQSSFFTYLPGERMRTFECTKDGGYIVITNADNYSVTKLDSLGQIQWFYTNNQFDGLDSSNNLRIIKPTLDNGYIAAGSIELINDYKMILIKFDSLGVVKWKKHYNNNNIGVKGYLDLIVENDSTYTVLGTDTSGYFTTKVSKYGDTSSSKTIHHSLNFYVPTKIEKVNNEYFVFGRGNAFIDSSYFYFERILKLDSSRNIISITSNTDTSSLSFNNGKCFGSENSLLWYNHFDVGNGTIFRQVNSFNLNGIQSYSKITDLYEANFESDSTIIGVSANPPQLSDTNYIYRYNFISDTKHKIGFIVPSTILNYEFNDFKKDFNNNILVSGSIDPNGFKSPFLARIPDTTIVGIKKEAKSETANFFIYPNPTNNDINIKLSNDFNDEIHFYNIEIFNLLGSKILEVANITNIIFPIDVHLWKKGVYILKITPDNRQLISYTKLTIY